jgi:hypothetical protein
MQNLFNAERRDPAGVLKLRHCCKPADGACAEVVVMIVRNHYGIDVRQILKCKWRGKETFGASPLRWGRALIPNRIDE